MLENCLNKDNLPLTVISLCPLLMVTSSVPGAMVMGTIFVIVLLISSLVLAAIGQLVPYKMRLPMILLVTALIVSLAESLLSVFYYKWYLTLGFYVSLLATNCLILVNIEENVLRNEIKKSLAQSLVTALSIWGVLLLTGLIRDCMSGRIFGGNTFIIFGMVPGAFIVLGFVVALIQYINLKTARA